MRHAVAYELGAVAARPGTLPPIEGLEMRRRVEMKAPLSVGATEITAAAFAAFGDVVHVVPDQLRTDWSARFENHRTNALLSLYTTAVEPTALPATLTLMERHEHSFQTFVPLAAARYLVCVAPGGEDDLPDIDKLQAFIVAAGVAITYNANVWHHPMMALDRTASFTVWMWRSGGDDDEEFVELSSSVRIEELS